MKILFIILLLLGFSSSAYAELCFENSDDSFATVACPTDPTNPTRADGLSGRNDGPTFGLDDLVKTSIEGMFDSSCGGYCITGVCAHLNWGVSWRRGFYIYTIISPRLRTAVPDLLIASYNHTGDHPFDAWKNTFESVVDAGNTSVIAALLGAEDGLQGGRGDPVKLDRHQSLSFKEVSIIGHPASILPEIVKTDGSLDDMPPLDYQIPRLGSLPSQNTANQIDGNNNNAVRDPDQPRSSDFDLSEMFDNTLVRVKDEIQERLEAAIRTLEGVELLESIQREIETIQDLGEFYDTAMTTVEGLWRGTIYGNAVSPRFRAPAIFCPTNMQPLQPHYLSLADAFYWRSGYPITDGPISGSDKSTTILNPFSDDTLKPDSLETWGHLYPREGAMNSNHDAKVATVTAWRAMDVLLNNVKDGANGTRVGVPLPATRRPSASSSRWGARPQDARWQMIYPEVKSCQASPAYDNNDVTRDFMEPNAEYGSYAWNYYNTYECCSYEGRRRYLGSIQFPSPICL